MSTNEQIRIAVASGKGGTGKTFVSTNIFETLRRQGKRTILVDCDVEVPNAQFFFSFQKIREEDVLEYRPVFNVDQCVFCDTCVDYCAFNAIFYLPKLSKIQLLANLCQGCGACAMACDQDAISDGVTKVGKVSVWEEKGQVNFVEGKMNEGQMSAVPTIKQTLKTAFSQDTDYVIVDAAPGASCPFIQTSSRVDFVLLVTEPTPFGLSDLRQAVESLRRIKKPFAVIINRAGLGNRDVYQYLQEEGIDLWAEIPFDQKIAKKYSKGQLQTEPGSTVKNIFEQLANNITHTIWK